MTTNILRMTRVAVPSACVVFGLIAALPAYAAQTGTNFVKPGAQTGTNFVKPGAQTGTNFVKPAAQTGTNSVVRSSAKKEGECEYTLSLAAASSC